MNKALFTAEEVRQLIRDNQPLILAGDETVLGRLPNGNWIGGTIPYFMGDQGGEFSREKIHVTFLPKGAANPVIRVYDEKTIQSVYSEAPEQGFSFIIIPATSKTHLHFSLQAPAFPDFATRPLIGWISGVNLEDLGKVTPKVFDGRTGKPIEDGAVVLGASLPPDHAAVLSIMNLFEPGDGDMLTFDADGFSAQEVWVNGQKRNFVDYLKKKNADTALPLVSNYYGARVNISFQAVDVDHNQVRFYAPVFKGVEYKLAKPIGNYIESFESAMKAKNLDGIVFSCNCILNYLYSGLEGKKTGTITGPITFGEIAYQLLNQTLVYMRIEKIG